MKQSFVVISLLFCLKLSAQYQFKIIGTAPNVFNGKKIYLTVEDKYSNQKYKIEDSTIVKNSNFFFSGVIQKPSENATILTKEKDISGFFYFVADSGLNTMKVNTLPPNWPLYKNKLSNTKVLNSRSNEIRSSFDSLTNYYFQTNGKPSKTNKYLIELDKETKALLRREQLEFLKQYSDDFYTVVLLYSQMKTGGGFRIEEAEELYEVLNSQLKNSVLGTEIMEIITSARSTEIGHPIPIFTVNTDKNVSFSNSTLKGSIYMLAFGATWCAPCKERIPMLKTLYEKYKKNGFTIVYVNLDDKTELWKKQINLYSMEQWVNVSERVKWEESQMAKRLNVTSIPYYLLVDKDGNISYNPYQLKDFDYQELDKAILSMTK